MRYAIPELNPSNSTTRGIRGTAHEKTNNPCNDGGNGSSNGAYEIDE